MCAQLRPGYLGVGPDAVHLQVGDLPGPRRHFNAAASNNPMRDLGRPQAGGGPLGTMNYKQTLL